MGRRSLVRRSLVVAALSVWMVTCGDPQTRSPTSPSASKASSAEISGPASVAPGQSAQFRATVQLTDGTTKILTTPAPVWWTSNSFLLQVTSAGVARAGSLTGEVVLSVDGTVPGQGHVTASREVMILPDGTYRLIGKVTDVELATAGIAGAHVQAFPGTASAITDSAGNFKLYGLPADSEVHVTSDGYQPTVQSVHLTGHASKDFQLTPAGPRLHLAGLYTLSIDAAPGCSGYFSLPVGLQHRSYQATVTQTGLTLQVTLTEPRFILDGSGLGNHIAGTAGIVGATFTFASYDIDYYYGLYLQQYPSIAERLSDGTALLISGSVSAKGTAAGLSGELNGALAHVTSGFPTSGYFMDSFCSSSSHQFTLTPR